jgi:hypothetical protein
LNDLIISLEFRYIASTRIRTGRSIDGLPFNPNMTEEQYKNMEEKAKAAFEKFPDTHAGTYYPLTGTDKEELFKD